MTDDGLRRGGRPQLLLLATRGSRRECELSTSYLIRVVSLADFCLAPAWSATLGPYISASRIEPTPSMQRGRV